MAADFIIVIFVFLYKGLDTQKNAIKKPAEAGFYSVLDSDYFKTLANCSLTLATDWVPSNLLY